RYLRHAAGRVELRHDGILVERPQPGRVEWLGGVGFDRVPEDLPQRRRIRRETRHDTLWQQTAAAHLVQLLQHALAGEVEVHAILEDDRNHREIELGGRADGLDPG